MRVATVDGGTTFLQSIGCLWVALGVTVSLQAFGASPFLAMLVSLPMYVTWVYISIPSNVMVPNVMYLCVDLFFREVTSRNTFKVPAKAPVLFVAGPHSNQLLDPLIVMHTCPRRVGFLCAAKTMKKRVIGFIAHALDSIKVERAQDLRHKATGKVRVAGDRLLGEGTRFAAELHVKDKVDVCGRELAIAEVLSDTEARLREPPADAALLPMDAQPFSALPHVDSSLLYQCVFDRLGASECVGIFPEGGSHDRTELLPLKMGAAIMALGACARFPGLPIQVVPVGLHYFQGHRFRGAVLVDYGEPLDVPAELVSAYERGGVAMQEACVQMLSLIEQGLSSVTITAPDYATLELFWMMRRLYMQKMVEETGKRPTLAQQVALTKAFSGGWAHIAAKQGVPELMEMVASYNQQLRLYGMKDYHVEANTRINNITLLRAAFLSTRMLFNGAVALPGLLLGLPLLAMTRYFSENERVKALKTSTVKITGRDVLATYKVLISLVFTPVLHVVYTAIVWRLVSERTAVVYMFFSPFVCWGAVRCAESSKLAYREAWAILSVMLTPTNLTQLRAQRKAIKEGVLDLFDDIALPSVKRSGSGGSRPRGALDDASQVDPGEPPEQWLELCEKLRANSLRLRRTGSFVSLDN